MALRNTVTRFGAVSQALHWLIVLGILAQYLLVESAEDEGAANAAMDWHRSIGLSLLALAVLRLVWRMLDRRPAWPATMKPHERTLARAAHVALYGLLVAIPMSGWALSSAEGDRIRYFGTFDVPALAVSPQVTVSSSEDDSEGPSEQFEEMHELLFNLLVVIAALHVAAALKHHFWNRDSVLRSMLPGGTES